jgi:hypothetical protein
LALIEKSAAAMCKSESKDFFIVAIFSYCNFAIKKYSSLSILNQHIKKNPPPEGRGFHLIT